MKTNNSDSTSSITGIHFQPHLPEYEVQHNENQYQQISQPEIPRAIPVPNEALNHHIDGEPMNQMLNPQQPFMMPPMNVALPNGRKYLSEGNIVHDSRASSVFTCSKCNFYGYSVVEHIRGKCTYISMVVVGLIGLWPLCLFPLCINKLKDVRHVCPRCFASVGYVKALNI